MNVSHALFSEFAKSDPSPLNAPTPPPRRIKSGGPLVNFGGAALDRLRAMRRGQLPTAANAAESQRRVTGMSQEQQNQYATQQRANLESEKQSRKEAKARERKLRLLSRGPGFAGLDTGEFDQERSDMTGGKITSPGQDLQTQVKQTRKEPTDDPMLQRTGMNTGTTPADTQTEGRPPTEQPVGGQTQPASQRTGRRPLFAGQQGGIKIPGVGAAAKYTMQNPGATGAMLGMPAAYAMFGGALEAGLNLAGRGYDAIRQRQNPTNPTITRSLAEYNPELTILLKTQEGMRARRDIRSTEVIRYAYG